MLKKLILHDMLGEPDNQIHFNTPLPYVHEKDTVTGHQLKYIDFVYDSLNTKPQDISFKFQLKEIILPVNDSSQVIQEKPSIIFPYKVKPVQIAPQLRNTTNFDWLTGLFILCLILLVWIRYEGDKRVSALFKAVFAKHNMNQLLRDGDIVHERITPGLMFIYLISLASLLLIFVRKFGAGYIWTDNTFILFSGLVSGLLILWLIKIASIRVTGKIFRTKNETDEYVVTNIIFNIATGLALFPFVFAGHYAENELSIYIGIGILILGNVLKFLRSIFVGLSAQSFPVIYLFLYLCTLEILPFLVMYKIIAG
ncbi:MAG TPA: DUF4271 domain-containing protein [Lentimicrobium sp.]|nr:DUF4271 domain-containing protein [Lentimicrobium sp.]